MRDWVCSTFNIRSLIVTDALNAAEQQTTPHKEVIIIRTMVT